MMAENPPGKTRLAAIRSGGRSVFGLTLDALAREVDGRLAPGDRVAFAGLIDDWPLDPQGQPVDPESLHEQLIAWRARPVPLPPGTRPGSAAGAVLGLLLGAALALPLGFMVYMLMHEIVLPPSLLSSDAVMWGVIGAIGLVGGAVGFVQGAMPSRAARALLRGLLGFFLGAMLAGILAGVAAFVLGGLLGVSQAEGAFAMGVVFGVVPLAAVCGGAVLGWIMARRAWKRWGAAAQAGS